MNKEDYNEDYFENGEEKQLSCYTKYHWMPTRTLTTASDIIRRANIKKTDTILDYGCAKGFLVKAFKWLGYEAYGIDKSKYAIDNCDLEVKERLFKNKYEILQMDSKIKFDVVICKDVAEHILYEEIDAFLLSIHDLTLKKAIFIIPLGDGKKYNIPRYEMDVTHKIKESLGWWVGKIENAGFKVIVVTDDLKDIKPNWNTPSGNIYIEALI